jgi:cyclopropane-fatty-acyl-phospholipid synthase
MSLATTDLAAAAAGTPRVFAMLLRLLASNWTVGRLTVHLPNGETHVLEGEQPGLSGVMHVKDYRFARRVLAAGDIGFAEGYMPCWRPWSRTMTTSAACSTATG